MNLNLNLINLNLSLSKNIISVGLIPQDPTVWSSANKRVLYVESVIDIYCSGSYIVFSPSMLHFKCMISLSLSLLRGGVGGWLEFVVLLVLM